jgi:hypothetical protein
MDDNFGIVDSAYNRKPVYASLKQAWGGSYPAPSTVTGTGTGTGTQTPVRGGSTTGAGANGPGTGSRGVTAGTRDLQVRIKKEGRYLVAHGVAPRGSRVELTVTRCAPRCKRVRISGSKRVVVKAAANGRFKRRLGKRSKLKRSRLNARVIGPSVVVSAALRRVTVRLG